MRMRNTWPTASISLRSKREDINCMRMMAFLFHLSFHTQEDECGDERNGMKVNTIKNLAGFSLWFLSD